MGKSWFSDENGKNLFSRSAKKVLGSRIKSGYVGVKQKKKKRKKLLAAKTYILFEAYYTFLSVSFFFFFFLPFILSIGEVGGSSAVNFTLTIYFCGL